ncbi:MAG: helix-turn-helix transcriptional regulator [Lachnospiraceae bacterium]|nr:helix-turn-helix transcriptional regulator [Lachnospiraceae bacterium]
MKKNVSHSISQNIKKYRLINNMTQEELAGKLNLDTQYYSQLERGERNFTIEKIIHLCSIFHIGVEEIIEVETTEPENTDILTKRLISELKNLSYTQLSVVEKFITDIVPYIK